MRKIESEMNAAIRGRRDWAKANTSVVINDSNDALVYLHGNFIAKVSQHFVQLFDGGWQSVTTKSRLNAILDDFHYKMVKVLLKTNSYLHKVSIHQLH